MTCEPGKSAMPYVYVNEVSRLQVDRLTDPVQTGQ